MNFKLESGKIKEINKIPEVKVDSKQLSETKETAENFDDCSLNDVQDFKRNDSLEDTEENYDDCEAKIEEIEEKNTEFAKDYYDDFNDCGKENDDENEDLTEESKEQISEEVSDSANKNLSEKDVETIVDEKADVIEYDVENKKDEKVNIEATAEELKNEHELAKQTSEQLEHSLQERIDVVFEKRKVSSAEINGLKEENAAELKAKIENKSITESELKSKFDEVLSKEKGSEEYKQSLQEYNALQYQKMMLDEQIAIMQKQQDFLNKKSIELRDAQIQKGSEAVAASTNTLAVVSILQERYDQTYYDTKANKTELASIREDSCSTIKELSAEKNSIKQAMDAKMDEISKYVISNNMVKYETAHNFHYQQLSAEYIAMKESYDRIGYSIVKLDENNKAITERLGDEYVSMMELPPSSRIAEVNDGTDTPGETNYFIDEAKAYEVLSPFKQGNWEQLTIQNKILAIDKLADYNAEILGVEYKPRIVYYKSENPCDFGGYSKNQNTIYMNEYNIHDAAETADTISHEYRHKYQHERAEKLETERDLEFRENFDNYIRAENDYQGYKEQLVESDAIAYAKEVKDKIAP